MEYQNIFENALQSKTALDEAKKEYTVIADRGGRITEFTGTIEYLVNQVFGYTLEVGASWQHERGNSKINRNPKTIKSLITNLNNAKANAARNGVSATQYYQD